MAYVDYKHCDICDTKVFYDANLNYDFEDYPQTGLYDLGDWKTICIDCSKTHEVSINKKDSAEHLYTHPQRELSDEEIDEVYNSIPEIKGYAPIYEFARAIIKASRREKVICNKCNDTGWVCENHPDQEVHECKYCGGAGMPCECTKESE